MLFLAEGPALTRNEIGEERTVRIYAALTEAAQEVADDS